VKRKNHHDEYGNAGGMILENNHPLDADRIALRLMFRAIAEYGRKVRLRRQAAEEKTEQSDTKPDQQVRQPRRKKKNVVSHEE
jgi:hypothetical protein